MEITNRLPLLGWDRITQQLPSLDRTINKIKQFMTSWAGFATMCSLFAGLAAAAMWGGQFGLLTTAVVGSVALILCKCSPKELAVSVERRLDPALQIQPNDESEDRLTAGARERRTANVPHLLRFVREVQIAILKQSPHFANENNLFAFLRDRFIEVDASRLTLLSLHPARLNPESEGYEITIQSEAPRGWIRFYLHKQDGLPIQNVQNVQRIERVAPFLSRAAAERNHFTALGLPFVDLDPLLIAFTLDHPQMELTQVQLLSTEPVRYRHRNMPMQNEVRAFDGLKLNFQTPEGPVSYYVSPLGGDIASPNELQGDPVFL